jgi:hypothetical protein
LDLLDKDCGPAGLIASLYVGKEDACKFADVLVDAPMASEVQGWRETGRLKYPPTILWRILVACNSLKDRPSFDLRCFVWKYETAHSPIFRDQ